MFYLPFDSSPACSSINTLFELITLMLLAPPQDHTDLPLCPPPPQTLLNFSFSPWPAMVTLLSVHTVGRALVSHPLRLL